MLASARDGVLYHVRITIEMLMFIEVPMLFSLSNNVSSFTSPQAVINHSQLDSSFPCAI